MTRQIPYSSNMELNSTLVFDGSFEIAAFKTKAGDWITIPLQTSYVYDPTQNLSILFMASAGSPGNNPVSVSNSPDLFPTHSVGRNDNDYNVDTDGLPEWSSNVLVDVQLNISK